VITVRCSPPMRAVEVIDPALESPYPGLLGPGIAADVGSTIGFKQTSELCSGQRESALRVPCLTLIAPEPEQLLES
jgi:hypothetical protein